VSEPDADAPEERASGGGWGDVARLLGIEVAACAVWGGALFLLDRASRRGGHWGKDTPAAIMPVVLALLVASVCGGSAWLFARWRRRRRPGPLSAEARAALAGRTVAVHSVLAALWVLATGGAALLTAGLFFIVPSAVVAYAATRIGLRLGARGRGG